MPKSFEIVQENPNDAVGGCGCACGEGKQEDCAGPFAVFYACDTDSGVSPHTVISLSCLEAARDDALDSSLPAVDVTFTEESDLTV